MRRDTSGCLFFQKRIIMKEPPYESKVFHDEETDNYYLAVETGERNEYYDDE